MLIVLKITFTNSDAPLDSVMVGTSKFQQLADESFYMEFAAPHTYRLKYYLGGVEEEHDIPIEGVY